MNILVHGAGAVGSLLGGLLAPHHDVTLVGRDPHMATIARAGLRIDGATMLHVRPRAATTIPRDERPDVVLVAVRATQTADAAADLARTSAARAVVVTVQNGLGNLETLRAALPGAVVLAAPVTTGALLRGPGHVSYAGVGQIVVGGAPPDRSHADRVAGLFREAGVATTAVDDIQGALWQKAIVNAAINPYSALTGKTNGELAEDPATRDGMRRVVDECLGVTRALGVDLPEPDAWRVVLRVAQATHDNRSSMQQALAQGRRTEVDAITGRIVAEAHRLGMHLPENERLLDAVHALERQRVGA